MILCPRRTGRWIWSYCWGALYRFDSFVNPYLRCRRCGLVYRKSLDRKSWEPMGASWMYPKYRPEITE